MNVYVDASVLLRVVLGQADRLPEWKSIREATASALVEVECLRTLDRLKLRAGLSDEDVAARRQAVYRMLAGIHLVEPTLPVLKRASQPLPTPLGTLDAIHLATALLLSERGRSDVRMATHGAALATAARACGLEVIGITG